MSKTKTSFSNGTHQCEIVNPTSNILQSLGPVVHSKHGRHIRQQCLRRADITSRLIPPDVLLPRLQRQPVTVPACGIPRHPDHPPRHQPHQRLRAREEPRVGPTVAQRHPEPLRSPHGYVGSELGGRPQEGQPQEVGGAADEGSVRVGVLCDRGEVQDVAFGVGVLEEDAGDVAVGEIGFEDVDDFCLEAQGAQAGLDDGDGLGVEFVGDQHYPALVVSGIGFGSVVGRILILASLETLHSFCLRFNTISAAFVFLSRIISV